MGIFVNGKLTNFYKDGKLVRPFVDGKQIVPLSGSSFSVGDTYVNWEVTLGVNTYTFKLGWGATIPVEVSLLLTAPSALLRPANDALKMITLIHKTDGQLMASTDWTHSWTGGDNITWTTPGTFPIPSSASNLEAYFTVEFT